jgi:hypothetical protein
VAWNHLPQEINSAEQYLDPLLVRLPAQPRTGFASFDVFAQHGIDGRLVAAAALAEER